MLTVVEVTRAHTFVRTHQPVHLKDINAIVYKQEIIKTTTTCLLIQRVKPKYNCLHKVHTDSKEFHTYPLQIVVYDSMPVSLLLAYLMMRICRQKSFPTDDSCGETWEEPLV